MYCARHSWKVGRRRNRKSGKIKIGENGKKNWKIRGKLIIMGKNWKLNKNESKVRKNWKLKENRKSGKKWNLKKHKGWEIKWKLGEKWKSGKIENRDKKKLKIWGMKIGTKNWKMKIWGKKLKKSIHRSAIHTHALKKLQSTWALHIGHVFSRSNQVATHSSQKICLQCNLVGSLKLSWQIGQVSPVAFNSSLLGMFPYLWKNYFVLAKIGIKKPIMAMKCAVPSQKLQLQKLYGTSRIFLSSRPPFTFTLGL